MDLDKGEAPQQPTAETGASKQDSASYVNRYRLSQRHYTPPKLVGDKAANEDALGFLPYAQALGDLIVSDRTETPLTVGVIGSWGSGKTTLLGFVRQRLNRANAPPSEDTGMGRRTIGAHVVSFDVWHHEGAEAVFPALARRILADVPLGMRARTSMLCLRVWRRLKRACRVSFPDFALRAVLVLSVALAVFGIVARFGFGYLQSAIAVLGVWIALGILRDLWSAPVIRWAGSLARGTVEGELPEQFLEVQADLGVADGCLTKHRKRAVLLVDDVDRCTPAKAVATLQAINLLSLHRSFVTMVAFDAGVLTTLVEKHFGHDSRGEFSGAAFLDKVIHVPFYLPTPSITDVQTFISSIVEPERRDVVILVDQPNILLGAAPLSEEEILRAESNAWDELAISLRPNPRHLKRLINVYRLTMSLAEQEHNWKVAARPLMTIGWLLMCAQWPQAAAWLAIALSPFGGGKNIDIVEFFKGQPYQRLLNLLETPEQATLLSFDRLENVAALKDLLRREECSPTTEDLQALRRFTIAFSPEVLSELEQPWVYLPPPTPLDAPK